MVTEMVTAIYSNDLEESKRFYADLLGLEVVFDSDWVVQLSSPANESINLTLQPRDHDLIPARFRKAPQGFSVAFVVPDADEVFERALEMGLEIIQRPKNEVYGQRRFLTVDPNGMLLDISADCEPSAEFAAKYLGG